MVFGSSSSETAGKNYRKNTQRLSQLLTDSRDLSFKQRQFSPAQIVLFCLWLEVALAWPGFSKAKAKAKLKSLPKAMA
jgi:hypothetical protein